MKNIFSNNLYQLGFVLLLGLVLIWLVDIAFYKTKQFVALCDANRSNCRTVQAEFSYDSGDGQFVIKKVYRGDATVTYSPVDCWVYGQGSECMNSATNQNMTGHDEIIIPLAYKQKVFRWNYE
jgi:hypothetical protein